MAQCYHLYRAFAAFYVVIQYRVQLGVVGQAVAVFLAGAQLCAGGFVQYVLRNYFAIAVDEACQCIDLHFVEIAEYAKSAGHIAVQGAVAGGQFAFIGGVEQDVAKLISKCHNHSSAYARLQVFLGQAEGQSFEDRLQCLLVGGINIFYGYDVVMIVQVFGELHGIVYRVTCRVLRRQQQGFYIVGAQCLAGQGKHYCAVYAAR